ncbi:pancreatic lipase-related protein 2-like [Plodia interpunctella]|uniref:pancreatic lipase-related protein 2-like n=1 Tax=Plodia interpunctella TaxID=58824 RepID=UPI002368B82F|nr:pancreatic lipase-related protein 2-like [Plodia interpunctella]
MQVYSYILYFCAPFLLAGSVNALTHRRNNTVEGYPVSFLTEDCPGSMKPVIISKNRLRFIKFYIYGYRSHMIKSKKVYTYNMMKQLAADPDMDWSKRTLLYVPGWMDNIYAFPMGRIMKVLYKRMGYNVIILDVIKFNTEEYPIAVRLMYTVGDLVGEMLAKLHAFQPKFDPKKLDLLGLSLGGHTMGFIAKGFYKRTGIKVARLTGMDPAGPCFKNRGPEGRVDESDADFVDLILTNVDMFGMAVPSGTVSIYVNGGEYQPGDFYWMYCGPFCSHARSFELWIAAVANPDAFIALKCDSVQDARDKKCFDRKPMETIKVGPNIDRSAKGIYYLSTSNYYPYALGEKGLKKETDYVWNKLIKMNDDEVLTL